jgi:hypothetical protein
MIMSFLNRNAGAIQALGAILTVVLAAAALIGVKVQIDAADRIQRAQSARDIYREFLSLSVANPKFSQPDYCAISKSGDLGAYESYVGYLLYSAEQLLAVDEGWRDVLRADLTVHAASVCALEEDEMRQHTPEVEALIKDVRDASCQQVKRCG